MNEHWKNCPPEETVNNITQLLKKYDIELRTDWVHDNNPVGVYSNCIVPFNQMICFKTAGKGITPSYAQASGFAEFIERFQTFMIYYRDYNRPFFKDETLDPVEKEGQYPYLNMLTGEEEVLSSTYLFSTGMASGNTDAEAIVHAICEIVERQTTMDFTRGKIQVNSRIPIENFNFKFRELENLINGKVQIFDVGRFEIPTVALICRNEETRQLIFKIDCGPTLELAIERCLTEFFQNNISNNMSYSYWQGVVPEEEVTDRDAIYGVLVDYHLGPLPGFLIEQIENAPVYEKIIDYNFESEEALIKQFLKACKQEYNYSGVYLRDFKWAGFPTVYIYIPDLINEEHTDLTAGQVFSHVFDYYIHEYENYHGRNIQLLEKLGNQLLIMFYSKPDPKIIVKHYNNNNQPNSYITVTQNIVKKMYEECRNFAMDVEYFKQFCL